MKYEYEYRPATPRGEGVAKVADVFVVRGVDVADRPSPSRELIDALQRLSPGIRALTQRLVEGGFEAAVRK